MPSLKQCYKFTEEFGYIPKDWNIAKVATKTNVVTGGTPSTKVSDYWNGNIKWMSSGELNNKRIYDVEGRITPLGLANSSATLIPENSILIGLAGQGKTRGTAAINYVELSTNQSIGAILPSKYFNSEFLYQCIDKRYDELRELSSGGGGRGGLNKALLMNLSILLPPLPEQEKIAEVLGDIDNLIDKTQQLINKKKDIKTATMQKLLTPNTEWENITLGEIGYTYSGINGKKKEDFGIGESLYITFLNVMSNPVIKTKIFEKVNITRNESQNLCLKGDLFFNTSSETPEEVGMCSTLQNDIPNLYLNSFCFGYRLKKENVVEPKFLAYLFRAKYGRDIMLRLAQGSTRYNLSKDNLMEYPILLPKFTQQKQIVAILSDMDDEIEALEKELNKYKDLKTGMMQQLLTGKIRLLGKSVKQDDKVVSIEDAAAHKVANDEFKDAILISVLAYKFGNEQYPLGAFRRQKLSYFYKRHANMNIDEYTKKAMGPYNSKIKYQGAENIAIRNKYVKKVGNRGIVATNLISKAEEYYNRYYNSADMQWLDTNFHYENNNNLEVLATVDYAINDLVNKNKAITLANIKTYIASDEEWRPKLELDYFTDNAIIKAMEKIKKLFNSY
jgi:type I restriction enzyme S subunit